MEEACKYIEKTVNEELRKRERYALEWGGSSGPDGYVWRANVAASNCYEGAKESVGFHSDQLTYSVPKNCPDDRRFFIVLLISS